MEKEMISKQVQSAIQPLAEIIHDLKEEVRGSRIEHKETAVSIEGILKEFKRLNGTVARHETDIRANSKWRWMMGGSIAVLAFVLGIIFR